MNTRKKGNYTVPEGDVFYYRYTDHMTAGSVDEYGKIIPNSGSVVVQLHKFRVLRFTPAGVWISLSFFNTGPGHTFEHTPHVYRRFILKEATKRFALPTIEEAKKSFIARKQRQIGIYQRRVEHAQEAINQLLRNDLLKFPMP